MLKNEYIFFYSSQDLSAPCRQVSPDALHVLTRQACCLRTLNLSGCKVLTDDLLKPVLSANARFLRTVDLSECHHLTAGCLQVASVQCKQLQRLILSDCHWVTR